jgi:glutamate synthase (NADPH/NADH) small chain
MAVEEGAQYQFLVQPVRFIAGADGRVAQIECVRTELGEPDENGRRKFSIIDGSDFIVKAETIIMALGYKPDPIISSTTPGIGTNQYGLLLADEHSGATNRKGVFTAGDIVTGPQLVVTAMAAGRKAAAAIDRYLGW